MAVTTWYELFYEHPPWHLLEKEQTNIRAQRLFEAGAVEITTCSVTELHATVIGRTGTYHSAFSCHGRQLRPACNCPSHARPCKHAGALAYAVLEEFGEQVDVYSVETVERDTSPGVDVDDEHVVPGVELDRRTVRRRSESDGQGAGDGRPPYTVERSLADLDPLPDRGIVVAPDGSLHYSGSGPSYSEQDKRYRPVFELIDGRADNPIVSGNISRLYVRAALRYIRRDGSDGALQAYSSGKPRLRASGLTEQLFRYLTLQQGCAAPAAVALAGAFERMQEAAHGEPRQSRNEHDPGEPDHSNQSGARMSGESGQSGDPGEPRQSRASGARPPADSIELYFEREPGRDPTPARALPVDRIEVRWHIVDVAGDQPRLMPQFVFTALRASADGEASECIVSPHAAELVDADGRVLLVPVEEAGALFYYFADPPDVFTLQRLLSASPRLDLDQATEFAKMCRSRLGERVTVCEPPAEITVLTVVPQPVVEILSVGNRGTMAKMRFRYSEDGEEIDVHDPATLLRAGDDSWSVFRRIFEVERRDFDRAERIIASRIDPEDLTYSRSGSTFDILIYLPAEELLRAVAVELVEAGFELRYHGTPVRPVDTTPSYRIVSSGEGWFEAELGLRTAEGFVRIENPPHRGALLDNGGAVYVFTGGEDLERFFARGKKVRFAPEDMASAALVEELADDPQHEAFERLRTLREQLAAFEKVESLDPPEGLECTLRPYQLHGLSWLWFLHEYGLGGCLADDMGLGKTVQTLACLLTARRREGMERALVVAPVTTLSNWKREIERFAPEFSACIHSGPVRPGRPEEFSEADIVLVSYATARMDIDLFGATPFDYLVLDEAQVVKNPASKTRSALRRLEIPHRIALSGTPIENNTIELWSLFDLLNPGVFGKLAEFRVRYARPIEDNDDAEARGRLHRIVHPLLLRRRKRDVAPELPDREERVHYAEPEEKQRRIYESLRLKFKKSIEKRVSQQGMNGARMHVLEAMLRLRQAAILPALVDPEYRSVPSAKLDQLEELIETVIQEGNKALVFSQFVAVIDEVERRLGGAPLMRIDGSTPQKRRSEMIDSFQSQPGPALFLISLKAGGFGINLTAADYVILLDPWWNPAVEAQAIDRAHRIGRDGTVIAYRMIAAGTIEEKMLRLQERKRDLAESIIRSDAGGLSALSAEDLQWLFGA